MTRICRAVNVFKQLIPFLDSVRLRSSEVDGNCWNFSLDSQLTTSVSGVATTTAARSTSRKNQTAWVNFCFSVSSTPTFLSFCLSFSVCMSIWQPLPPPPDFSRRKKVRFRWNCDAIKGARVTPTQLRRNNRPTAGASGWHSTSEPKNPIPKWGRCEAPNAKNRREVRKNASIGGTKEKELLLGAT